MTLIRFLTLLSLILISYNPISGQQILMIPPDTLQAHIFAEKSLPYNFILIDLRTEFEVESGIIASDYCKPYHMSIGFEELQANASLLPKDIPIILYCKTSVRAVEGANILIGLDFTMVGYVTGGISAYKGQLHDSIEFKPWSSLPEPSYFGSVAVISKNNRRPHLIPASDENRQRFTLQGRLITQLSTGQNAPIYILERIGEKSSGRINGLQRLVEKR